MRIMCNHRIVAALAALLCVPAVPAHAGPPFVTDDPEPTETGHWEIYNFATGDHVPGTTAGAAGLDLNYGRADNLQLTAVIPMQFQSQGQIGLGNIELAAKYRFLRQSEDSALPDVAFFPRLFVPTAGRQFGSGRANLLLPIWAERDFGPWSLFGGGGYVINPGPGNRDYWLGGIVVSRAVTDDLAVGVELYHQAPTASDARAFTGLNIGVTYKLTDHWSLLASGGPGLENPESEGEYAFYFALKADY
jgi:hypothetical protein